MGFDLTTKSVIEVLDEPETSVDIYGNMRWGKEMIAYQWAWRQCCRDILRGKTWVYWLRYWILFIFFQ